VEANATLAVIGCVVLGVNVPIAALESENDGVYAYALPFASAPAAVNVSLEPIAYGPGDAGVTLSVIGAGVLDAEVETKAYGVDAPFALEMPTYPLVPAFAIPLALAVAVSTVV
jgi:hypothetical protein